MSGRRSSNVEGSVRGRETRHAQILGCLGFDGKAGRRHIDKDGDRLFGDLSLSLYPCELRLGVNNSDSTRATSSAEAIAPANWALTMSNDRRYRSIDWV